MRWFLEQEGGAFRIKIAISKSLFTIGSAPWCDLSIPSKECSEEEALIHSERNKLFIIPSSNPSQIKVNGQTIQARTALYEGDSIEVCQQKWHIIIGKKTEEEPTTRRLPERGTSKRIKTLPVLEIRTDEGIKRVRITKPQILLGASNVCDIVIRTEFMSRRHASIYKDESYRWWIEDLDSTNGTYLNGRKIAKAILHDKDYIELGDTEIRFLISQEEQELQSYDFGIVGISKEIQTIRELIEKFGPTGAPVLITGESGTGKELVARGIHEASGLGGEFIAVNAAAIPAGTIESQLFGHKRGAFTGANERSEGLIMAAEGGTLFLDEIGEMPLDLQSKLLRVVETHKIMPVGESKPRFVNTRFVFATNRNLEEETKAGRFRKDLYYRIMALHIHIPPLRERLTDIVALSKFFLKEMDAELHLSASAIEKLSSHSWPGNIRELKNVLFRSVVLGGTELLNKKILDADDILIEDLHFSEQSQTIPNSLQTSEKEQILLALKACNGNKTAAAKRLGIARSTLYEKIRLYKIKA